MEQAVALGALAGVGAQPTDRGQRAPDARDATGHANLTRALRTLGGCNRVLVEARDEPALLQGTCETIVDAGGYPLAWVGYTEQDAGRTIAPMASAGRTGYLDEVLVTWSEDVSGRGPAGRAARLRRPQVLRDTHRSRLFAPWRAAADRHGLRAICAVPFGAGTGDGAPAVGVLSIYAGEPGAFDEHALRVLHQLGEDLSYGIGRLRDASALEVSEERFRALAAAAPIGILEVAPGGDVTYANARSGEIAGRDATALTGRRWIDVVLAEDAPRLLAALRDGRRRCGLVDVGFRIERPDGEIRHVKLAAAPLHGRSSGYVVTLADVSAELLAREALSHQAFYDPLTGLPNRALCLDRLAQALAGAERGGPSFAVLLLDLDRLKVVNDSLGHEAGDAVLQQLAGRFAAALRSGETVARFNGDEFVFLVRDVRGPEDAVAAARGLLALLETPVRHEGEELTLTASVGIALPHAGADPLALVRDAGTAMFEAKRSGGNRWELFDEELHRRALARLALEGELREGLARRQFELWYQPSIDLATGLPRGAEALIRWRHPVRGLVSPADFVPVAEETGLIRPIGEWVIREAVAQLARWDAEPRGPRLAVLAVNVAARQLGEGVSRVLEATLERFGVAPERIAVELTESAVMSDRPEVREALEHFRRLDVRMAIDDFGTGYSSLARLHTLPMTTVKIDRSFVGRLGAEDDSTPVVQAIVDMAHAMGRRVVAEGVEDEAQSRLLRDLGCDGAQGFLWARPMPAAELARWWVADAGPARAAAAQRPAGRSSERAAPTT